MLRALVRVSVQKLTVETENAWLTNLSFYSAHDSASNHTHPRARAHTHTHTQNSYKYYSLPNVQNIIHGPGTHYGDADGIYGNVAGRFGAVLFKSDRPFTKQTVASPTSEVNITRDRIAGLHPQNPRHFPRQPSARLSRILWSSYLSDMIVVTK